MASPTKDRITCHVLDTSTGTPARAVRVQLSTTTTASSSPAPAPGQPALPKTFESLTDDDGRIKAWLPYSSSSTAGEVPVYTLEDVLGEIQGPSRWELRFDTSAYFGGDDKTFFPEAVVVFTVQEGQHYHVPLLVSPYSYTTYRGS